MSVIPNSVPFNSRHPTPNIHTHTHTQRFNNVNSVHIANDVVGTGVVVLVVAVVASLARATMRSAIFHPVAPVLACAEVHTNDSAVVVADDVM